MEKQDNIKIGDRKLNDTITKIIFLDKEILFYVPESGIESIQKASQPTSSREKEYIQFQSKKEK